MLYWNRFLDLEVLKKLVVAVIPTGVIGLTVYKAIKGYLLGNVTGRALSRSLVGGIALIVFERFRSDDDRDVDFTEITYRKAFLIGLFQAIAVIPGVSRSAATIVGGSLLGVSKRTIVEFSFMLAVPTMLAATGLELLKNRAALERQLRRARDRIRRQLPHRHPRDQVVPRLHQEARLLRRSAGTASCSRSCSTLSSSADADERTATTAFAPPSWRRCWACRASSCSRR